MTSSKTAQNQSQQSSQPQAAAPLFISVGMMAHNEAARIETALRSLLNQDLLQRHPDREKSLARIVELRILANGCIDETANIARETLAKTAQLPHFNNLRWSVDIIEQPGKSNAWNLFVHQLSDPKADYLMLMDADIELLGTNSLQSLVDTLASNPYAYVTVDQPIKDVVLKTTRKTLPERISTAISGLSGEKFARVKEASPAWLCGQLYCGRATALRQIHLPVSSLAEDGLLYALLVTDSLRSPTNPHRVILAKSAAHSFEAYTKLGLLLKHERWLLASNSANELIFAHLRRLGLTGPAAGNYIRDRNQENPRWLHELVEKAAQQHRWLLPPFIFTRRFASLSAKPVLSALLMLPMAIAACLVDTWLAYLANRDLHRGVALKYWDKPSAASTASLQSTKRKAVSPTAPLPKISLPSKR